MLNVNRMKKKRKTRLSYYSSRPSRLVCKPTNVITLAEVEKVKGQLKLLHCWKPTIYCRTGFQVPLRRDSYQAFSTFWHDINFSQRDNRAAVIHFGVPFNSTGSITCRWENQTEFSSEPLSDLLKKSKYMVLAKRKSLIKKSLLGSLSSSLSSSSTLSSSL